MPRAFFGTFFGTFFRFERKYYPFGAAAPPLAPESARQAPSRKKYHSKFFALRSVPAGTTEVFRHSLPPFHSKHAIELLTSFRISRNASRPLIKQARTFYPFPTKKAGSPTFSMRLPTFYFILARADSAVAHNTVLAPAKPYNDSASHSGRNTPPVRSPDDRCAAAADSSPADAALAGIPPTASA